jgi:hypothetical protein
MDDPFELIAPKQEKSSVIVRLKTSFWHDKNGVHQKKTLSTLIRKSVGFNFLKEDCAMIGADVVIDRVVNFNECEDGIYEVVMCNKKIDWETGCLDDWDYKLVKK